MLTRRRCTAVLVLLMPLAGVACVRCAAGHDFVFGRTDASVFAQNAQSETSVAARGLVDCAAICGQCLNCEGFAVSDADYTDCHLLAKGNKTQCNSSVLMLDTRPFSPAGNRSYYSRADPSDTGLGCISCDSTVDPSCTETSAPSATVPCTDGACYIAKENGTGVIRRGCRLHSDLTASSMLNPEPGIQICSADPPGVKGTYICLCDGKNCNDQTWSAMGGPQLEGYGDIYEQVYFCQCHNDSTPCFLDGEVTIRGCTSNPCACIN